MQSPLACTHGQISAAVQAEHYRGKAVGLYEERLKITASISDKELVGRIEELFDKELAAKVASALDPLN